MAPDSYVATPSSPYGIFGAHFSSWRKQLGSRGLSADCPVTADVISEEKAKRTSQANLEKKNIELKHEQERTEITLIIRLHPKGLIFV